MSKCSSRSAVGVSLCLIACLLAGCSEDSSNGGDPAAPVAGTGGAPVAGTPVAGMPVAGTPTAGMPVAGTPTAGAPMQPTGPTGDPTFTAIFDEILTNGMTGNCMFAGCHGGAPSPAGNGNLQIAFGDKQGAYDNLVNKVSDSPMCAGMTLVVPGNSQGSLLIQKFSPTPPCGMTMPVGPPLDAALVTQIATWIDAGALND